MLLPFIYRNSRALSKLPESEQLGSIMGKRSVVRLPKTLDVILPSLAFIQLLLPLIVLISPLWEINLLGIALSQLGKVLVEKRE